MSFRPAIPLAGVGGWALLQRVEAGQREVFERRPDVAREAERFAARIGEVTTAEALVRDRRLLSVALGAFGLEAEIDKRALLRRVLESDPADPESFANRLVDRRYREIAAAFGFGAPGGPETVRPGFAARIVDAYKARAYETALGESDPAMRLALNARRELAEIAAAPTAETSGWFTVLGDRPLRRVVEGAYGLPDAFARLDVDRQREILETKTRDLFGKADPTVFADPDTVDALIRRFLAREAAAAGPVPTTPGATALALLTGGGLGAGGSRNLLLSLSG